MKITTVTVTAQVDYAGARGSYQNVNITAELGEDESLVDAIEYINIEARKASDHYRAIHALENDGAPDSQDLYDPNSGLVSRNAIANQLQQYMQESQQQRSLGDAIRQYNEQRYNSSLQQGVITGVTT